MKKILTILGLLFASQITSHAQAPRMQLYEVFSGENCGPCASANPTTHTLLTNNSSSIIGLKYQVPIPSAGPIHLQNPTEPNARRSYYSINSAPNARHDGQVLGNGHSLNLNQTVINNRQAVSSPFNIQLEHNFNSNWDTVFIQMTITASQAVGSGNWFARVALIERHMSYTSPPGSNGETEFYNVMRKMVPNPTGTSLPATWTNGQSQVINLAARVPTYIRDITELGVIAFVQNDATKEVAQAQKSDPLPVPINSKLNYTTGAFYMCSPDFTPEVNIQNEGTTTITEMEIRQTIGTNVQTTTWNGNLAPGVSTTVTLSQATVPVGKSSFEFRVLTMNGSNHPSALRATATGSIYYTPDQVNELSTGFTGTFPPTGWVVNNGTSLSDGWRIGLPGANGTNRSALINFYVIPSGDIAYLYLPRLDMSQASVSANIDFYVAHAQYTLATADKLEIEVSTDCGETWNVLFNKSGTQLSTRAPMSGPFNNVAASEWRQESVSLSSVAGQSDVLIRFKGTSNYGNNLYIDEVVIPNTVSVKEETAALPLRAYPNPVNDDLFIDFNKDMEGLATVLIRNNLGQLVLEQKILLENGNSILKVDVAMLSPGIYTVQSFINGQNQLSKIIKL